MNEEKDLQELLAEKVKAEFDAWVGDISRNCIEQADDILAEYAYEYVYKQEIVSIVEHLHFSDEETQRLLSYQGLLDFLYEEWMHCDTTVTDVLIYCIRDAVENFDKIEGSFWALLFLVLQPKSNVSYPRLKSWACNESCKPMYGSRCQSTRWLTR